MKVALVGCGGRGTGAATQTLKVEGVKLVAMADAFGDNLENAYGNLKTAFADKVDVPEERKFSGFSAYQQAIDCADVVLLCTPPGFRPEHFEYAIAKGKHVFMEKLKVVWQSTVQVDGIPRMLDAFIDNTVVKE